MAGQTIDLSAGLVPKGTSTAPSAATSQTIDLSSGLTPIQAPQASSPSLLSSPGDILSTVGSHLKNMIAGPYKAFTQPADPNNQQEVNASAPWSQGGAGKLGLGLYRMTAEPTVENAKLAVRKFQAGDKQGAANSAMDALPLVGPWARQIEADTQQKGALAGLAGLATDVLAPKGVVKLGGTALRTSGWVTKAASATPESLQKGITRAVVPGTPQELLVRGLKPSIAKPDFEQQLTRALPAITAEAPLPGVRGFQLATDAAKEKQAVWYNDLKAPFSNVPISTEPVAQAQMASIPATNFVEDVGRPTLRGITVSAGPDGGTLSMAGAVGGRGILDRTAEKANQYMGTKPLGQVDAIRQDTNAKLRGFYNKAGGDQYAALSDPETARVKAVNDATRDLTYSNLSRLSGMGRTDGGVSIPGIQGRQQLFGDLSDISDVAGKRATVFSRQNPLSLQESMAAAPGRPVAGMFDFAGQRFLKKATDSDALVNSALDRYLNPSETPLIPRPGIGPATAMVTGNAQAKLGKLLVRSPLAANPLLYTPKQQAR